MRQPRQQVFPVLVAAERPVRSLLLSVRPAWPRLGLAVAAYVVKDSPLWVLPVVTSLIIDGVVKGAPVTQLLAPPAVAALLILLNYPVTQVFVRLFMSTVRDLGAALRSRLMQRLQELSIGFHNRASAHAMQTKVVRDVESIELMLQQGANPALSAIGVILGVVIVVAVQVPAFLVVFALVVPVAVVLLRQIRTRSASRNERFRRDVEQFSSQVGEMATLLPITRAHGLERVAVSRVTDGARLVRDSGFSVDLLNGRFAAIGYVAFQLLALGCLTGAALLSVTGVLPITAGQVVLLSTYFVMLTGSIVNLLNLTPILTRGREAFRSIGEVLEEGDVEHNDGKTQVDAVRGDLRFRDVTFRYAGAAGNAVEAFDLEVHHGQTVAFVGRSGSGKSTVLNLALGFLRPTGGRIEIDGRDMQDLDLRTVRRHVSVVPQASAVFSGSVRDNITYGMPDVDDEVLHRALQDANLAEVIEALPERLEARLGSGGVQLSGGQLQRLSIARALIRDPRLLLLDEATSALDSESEHLVAQALTRLRRGRTTLVVAHRFATIRDSDVIVMMDDGRIQQVGDHEGLLAEDGPYARMWALQTR